ncbi:MAG TPA: RsmE family RNA methyltransferase [bacterium]|nr:RsmE family RNA methyltransferase [bacterium]
MTRKTPPGNADVLRRFFVPPNSIVGTQVLFPADEARHVAAVLRLHPGDQVVVIDGTGVERTVVLTEVASGKVAGRVVETRAILQRGVLALVQGVPKGARMDDVVRMGTELGVSEFFPFLSTRTVAEGRGRTGRWQRIAVESAKQSRRSDVPAVHAPAPLHDVLVHIAGYNLIVMLWEGEQSRTMAQALAPLADPASVAIIVGPEGGLAETEVDAAVARGAVPVTLGPLILRTETAGVVALAIVRYELGRRGGREVRITTESS